MFLPVTEQCLCNYSNEQFNDGMNYSHSCSYFSFGRCLPGVVLCDSIGVFGLGGGRRDMSVCYRYSGARELGY